MVQAVSDVGVGSPARDTQEKPGELSDREHEIAQAYAAGERRTVIALCARYYAEGIGRVCMAMVGVQSEAEELAQDTLLAAFTQLDNYRGDAGFRAWLTGIARKKCLKHLEKRRTKRAKLFLIQGGEQEQPADEALQQRQRAAYARQALAQIKPTEREALVMRYAGELSFKGVAEACGVAEPAARKRVSRAPSSLRQALETTAAQ